MRRLDIRFDVDEVVMTSPTTFLADPAAWMMP
jgi:hypothetical protein